MPDLSAMPRRSHHAAPLNADAAEPAIAAAPAAGPHKAVVILNTRGGGVARLGPAETLARIANAFAAHGIAAEVILSGGPTIARIAREHIGPPLTSTAAMPLAIVAAGGDGTVRAIAQELVDGVVPLGILPLGTLNHFARDLGLPLDIPGAVAVIAEGIIATVDAAEVNGRIFVNNSAIGLYPNMVRDRDRQLRQSRRKKWLAMALAVLHVLRRPAARRLTIEAEGLVQQHRTPLAFVGNNFYTMSFPTLGRRARLDDGELCLFIAKPRGRFGVIGLVLRTVFGRLDQESGFEQHRLTSVIVRSRHRHLTVSLDGEITRLRTPLRYRTRPRALCVLVPRPAPQ